MTVQLPNLWWAFILLGVCAGVLSGALGLGSGTILVPTLVLLCGFMQESAQGMALAVMVPMALLGAFRYWKNPQIEINLAVVGLIICGALVGTLAGTELTSRLPGHVLRKAFAIFLIIIAAKMLFGSSKTKKIDLDSNLTVQKKMNLVEFGDASNETGKQ